MRSLKQIVYGIIFIVVVALIIWVLYLLFGTSAPSCFDNSQNQRETGIDCGGPCIPCESKTLKDIETRSTNVLQISGGFSVAVGIYNPNIGWGASSFQYDISVKDVLGKVLAKASDSSFIYSGELKYIVIPFLSGEFDKAKVVEVAIKNENWAQDKYFKKPDVDSQDIRLSKDGLLYVSGTAINKSEADVNSVSISALLYNPQNELIAVSKTALGEIPKFESKEFKIAFPKEIGIYESNVILGFSFSRDLKIGDSGADVGYLQMILAEKQLLQREPTNYYDDLTFQAVKVLQTQLGVEQSGLIDSETRTKLNATLSVQSAPSNQSSDKKSADPSKTKIFIEAKS